MLNKINNQDDVTKSKVALQQFLDSMELNYEKWHDGIGYDLHLLDEMTPDDKNKVVDLLINLDPSNAWRNLEALDHINTPEALTAINTALHHPSLEVRIFASRFAAGVDKDREKILIDAVENSEIYSGLSQALDQIAIFHPDGIIDALLRGLLKRDSEAVNFAGMLFFIFGKAKTTFDWDFRPFFLQFNTNNPMKREKAFIELCNTIGVDSKKYLEY